MMNNVTPSLVETTITLLL